MIERIPDDKMEYVFNILQNIEAISVSQSVQDNSATKAAFDTLMKYQKVLPAEFDYKAELESARDEKYEDFS